MSFITAIMLSRLVGRRRIGTVDCQVFYGSSGFEAGPTPVVLRFIVLSHLGRSSPRGS